MIDNAAGKCYILIARLRRQRKGRPVGGRACKATERCSPIRFHYQR